jgi:hypothetical protein
VQPVLDNLHFLILAVQLGLSGKKLFIGGFQFLIALLELDLGFLSVIDVGKGACYTSSPALAVKQRLAPGQKPFVFTIFALKRYSQE